MENGWVFYNFVFSIMMSSGIRFRKKAFSLVEVLVVVSVIGILTAVAIPSITKIRERAKEGVARSNARQIASLSSAANAVGVYHVVPEHLGGGVEMSIDILLAVGKGAADLEGFDLSISDYDMELASEYLSVEYRGRRYVLDFVSE